MKLLFVHFPLLVALTFRLIHFLGQYNVATGSYTLIESEDKEYYELEYEEASYLIQNCGSSLKEHISILNNKEIFNGGYLPCDGPGFGYRLIN